MMLLGSKSLRAVRPVSGAARPVPVRAVVARSKTADADVKVSKKESKKEEEDEFEDGPDHLPSTSQVEALINSLCNETDIAEMNLKMGTFSLKVKRSMVGHHAAPAAAPAAAAPVAVAAAPEAAAPMTASIEETVDESLVVMTSPKVGTFRRGKYAAGKRVGKNNMVNEGDKVKKGQALGYVEQLGTHFPVEASIAGELVKFHIADGAPVAYQEMVAEVSPYFGGHIIGDSKHA